MGKQKLTIYKLHFTTPLHLGDVRDDYSASLKTISSDTIYSAFIACLAKYGYPVPQDGDLGCTVSSLFPFYQKNKEDKSVLFFPKPLRQAVPKLSDVSKAKKVRKVLWLDSNYFADAINGKEIFNDNAVSDVHGDFLTNDKDFDEKFMTTETTPRVSIVSRMGTDDAEPFYMERLYFKGYSGMFFISQGDNTQLSKAMALLQNEGIGTDRNVGNGYFEFDPNVDIEAIELDIPDNSGFAMSLSSFVPDDETQLKDMISSDNVAYDFQRRGGWITDYPHNSFRKNSIYAFVCGSVFKKDISSIDCLGKVNVNLKPTIGFNEIQHPIWRCGRSIFIPVKNNG